MSDAIRALAGLVSASNSAALGSTGSAYGVGAASANGTSSASATDGLSTANFGLNSDEFFQLFLSQLQNQDPTQPMDDKDMVGQLAQFTMIQTLQQVSAALDGSRLAQSAGLIGKNITGYDEKGDTVTGIVDRVDQTTDGFWLIVGDHRISPNSVSSVSPTPSAPTTTGA